VSKLTTVALGALAVVPGIAFEKQNIAFMVSLAFAIAASATRRACRQRALRPDPLSNEIDCFRVQSHANLIFVKV